MAQTFDQSLARGAPASSVENKPIALYFRHRLPASANPIRAFQDREIVELLSCSFEVKIVEDGGDYAALVDRHRPDLAVFEINSGPNPPAPLAGVRDDTSVPKALLIRSDSMCHTRPVLLQRVESYGIDACFAVDSLYGYYLEELRDRLFYMPHSVNPALFCDYQLPKTDTVTFFGHFLPSRPWRIGAANELRRSFPCTFLPHDSSRTTAATTRMSHGTDYARRISSARFVPVEGGFHHGITRKFFEVPACRAALVAPRIEGLAEYGFRHMENCILGEPAELAGMMRQLLEDGDAYASLVDAGARLVQERHVQRERTQLREWLDAFRRARPGEVVRQRGIFSGFETRAASDTGRVSAPIRADMPIDQYLLGKAEVAIRERRLADAEADLVRCMNLLYARYFLEPRFYLAMVRLLQGRANEAIYFLVGNYVNRVVPRGGRTLDPREAAMLIVAYRCLDQHDKATGIARLHLALSHPELDRASRSAGIVPERREGERTRSLFPRAKIETNGEWAEFINDALLAHALTAPAPIQ